ncbi:hypothetical protein H2203_003574 [Taxawa tesnikishii (nom. ined.)]|nr:hypothetical protein H2203_003574 [Dothideales sp. JES 119]
MRVLPETYYRIELPGETEDDKRMVGDLKVTLQKASPPSKPSPAYGLDGMLEENQDTASDVNSGSKSPSTPELPPTPVSIDATQDERFPDEPSATPAEDERLQEPRQEDHTEPAKGDFPSEEAVSDHCQDSSSDRSSDFEEAQTGQPSQLATPALTSDSEDLFWSEVQTPPETIRLRHRNVGVSDRAVSPHPDMSRLYRSSPSESQRALTGALVRKTCAIFLGPPAHLVTLMLRIAAKIADGAFSFTIHTPERGRRVPGSWDLSDDEGDWDIDEYGSFPLQNAAGKRQAWEVR